MTKAPGKDLMFVDKVPGKGLMFVDATLNRKTAKSAMIDTGATYNFVFEI